MRDTFLDSFAPFHYIVRWPLCLCFRSGCSLLVLPSTSCHFVFYTMRVRGRFFAFTLNNPEYDLDWDDVQKAGGRYLVYQTEIGESGTVHFQGYLEMEYPTTIRVVAGIFEGLAHVELARVPDRACSYAQKEDSRLEGPWIHGERVKQGQRTSDIVPYVEAIKAGKTDIELINEFPSQFCRMDRVIGRIRNAMQVHRTTKPRVYVFYGPTDKVKTGTCERMSKVNNEGDIFVYNANRPWWDGYRNQPVVIVNEWRCQMGLSEFNQWIDRVPYSVQVKGSTLIFNSPYIYITSNIPLCDWYTKYRSFDRATVYRRIDRYFAWSEDRNRFVEEYLERSSPSEFPAVEGLDGKEILSSASFISQSSEVSLEQSPSASQSVSEAFDSSGEIGSSLLQEDN